MTSNRLKEFITTFLGIFGTIYGIIILSFLLSNFNLLFLWIGILGILFGMALVGYNYYKVMT